MPGWRYGCAGLDLGLEVGLDLGLDVDPGYRWCYGRSQELPAVTVIPPTFREDNIMWIKNSRLTIQVAWVMNIVHCTLASYTPRGIGGLDCTLFTARV